MIRNIYFLRLEGKAQNVKSNYPSWGGHIVDFFPSLLCIFKYSKIGEHVIFIRFKNNNNNFKTAE